MILGTERKRHLLYIVTVFFTILLLGLSVFFAYELNTTSTETRSGAQSQPPAEANELVVNINNAAEGHVISKHLWGVNHWSGPPWGKNLEELNNHIPPSIQSNMGIKLLRFPWGPTSYNWHEGHVQYKKSVDGEVITHERITVDEVLQLSQQINAEVYYMVNNEIHNDVPEPAGPISAYPGTPDKEHNKNVLLNDVRELIKKYKGQLKYFQLGNEPWGGWDPQVYAQVSVEFAQVMKAEDPSIHITIVGFPSTGNNQNLQQNTENRERQWTKAIQGVLNEKCGNVDCFDSVSNHIYPFQVQTDLGGGYPGIAAYTSTSIYDPMFDEMRQTYKNKEIAISEWNIMCWRQEYGTGWEKTLDHGFNTYNMMYSLMKNNVKIGSYHLLGYDDCGLLKDNR
ncbi:MAG: hypothetical protein ACOCXT_01290, partial [Candidatus Dojkabacteria bacterium]